ncbi:hypothetical protein [Nocardia transvalensis]|uniref:hypothetical protein n=1 Tax=Nocardia transvalensis TaxID=37333 RepID=UPI001894032E|nr:hypothetical protein [Nocardia transvalensis]MBF6333546.1 hypothetical protein [Nocardia transvalensis]
MTPPSPPSPDRSILQRLTASESDYDSACADLCAALNDMYFEDPTDLDDEPVMPESFQACLRFEPRGKTMGGPCFVEFEIHRPDHDCPNGKDLAVHEPFTDRAAALVWSRERFGRMLADNPGLVAEVIYVLVTPELTLTARGPAWHVFDEISQWEHDDSHRDHRRSA